MKRKYSVLVLVAFFMFLYIGPVNLLPSSIPPDIVQRPQEPTLEKIDDFAVATDISVVLAADTDDDYWDDESHVTTSATAHLLYYAIGERSPQWRFQLNIVKDATITSANFTVYEGSSLGSTLTAELRRIDEDDVGSLEGDSSLPDVVDTNLVEWSFDGSSAEWETIDITDIVQDQVNLAGWAADQYIGFRMNATPFNEDDYCLFEDYQGAGTNHPYMNITYENGGEPPPEYDCDIETISVTLAADVDDDEWWTPWPEAGSAVHDTDDIYGRAGWYNAPNQSAIQWRFQLDIPQNATILDVSFSFYVLWSGEAGEQLLYLRRINESNVGSLEGDGTMPEVVETNKVLVENDDLGDDFWMNISCTDFVQDQVNLAGWAADQYIGFRLNTTTDVEDSYFVTEDYQHSGTHHPYMNVTYSNSTYGENWLDGWNRRNRHVIFQTEGTDANYTVPFWVYSGDGTNTGNSVYLNETGQVDFEDVRWTNGSGDVLLDFNLNYTEGGDWVNYYASDGVVFSHYPANYPAAWYYNDRTYVVIHGPNGEDASSGDPYIRYYDHENSTWSNRVKIADTPLTGDDHGAPCLFVNSTGHIHVFYGSHNSPVKHAVSDNAEDITSWTILDDVFNPGDGSTYPHLSYDSENNVAHAYMRGDLGSPSQDQHLRYYNSSDGGQTWNEGQVLMNVNDGQIFPYMEGAGGIDPYDSDLLHITWTAYNVTAESNYQDIYYIYVDVSTGLVYNASGNSQGYNVTTPTELDNCKVYDTGGAFTWGPSVHVDSDSNPYIIWTQETAQSNNESTKFSYWTGSAWAATVNVSWPYKVAAPSDFVVHASDNITAFLGDQMNMARFTWDGETWTNAETIHVAPGSQPLTFSHVPSGGVYNETIQVIFAERFGGDLGWAWGSDDLIGENLTTRALFYVTIPCNLTECTVAMYIYYNNSAVGSASQQLDYTTGNDPTHGGWGVVETAGYFYPVNYQAPTFDNPDDTDNMYARFKEYNITMYVSDQNGYADIDYLKLGFWDDGRSNNYARWRYDSPENTFVEEYDWDDYFELNLTKSEATKSGDYINCTFVFTVDWSCPDLTDVHMEVTVVDNGSLYDVDDHHFLTWDVETRLDFSTFLLDDGSGTADRGDYDTLDGIIASGTIDYYGSAISPNSGDVDVWVSCSDVEGGPWSDTTLVDGVFSVTVDSDNVVGLDTYSFIVVEKGEGVGGSDLSHTSHSDTYIADRLIVDIQADDETPFNDQQVNFTLTIIYDYDDTVCSTYSIVVSRNAVWWHSFINGNKTLFNDTNSDVAYAYTTYDISESAHGLTKYSSGSESVTWSGEATTTITTFPTTPVTETGIFYELFLSLDMWGYLGPLGIVVIGYVLAKKDRGLGLVAFMVQCLIAAQYFALIVTEPAYWWHVLIILFGGIFSCVVPLMDRK